MPCLFSLKELVFYKHVIFFPELQPKGTCYEVFNVLKFYCMIVNGVYKAHDIFLHVSRPPLVELHWVCCYLLLLFPPNKNTPNMDAFRLTITGPGYMHLYFRLKVVITVDWVNCKKRTCISSVAIGHIYVVLGTYMFSCSIFDWRLFNVSISMFPIYIVFKLNCSNFWKADDEGGMAGFGGDTEAHPYVSFTINLVWVRGMTLSVHCIGSILVAIINKGRLRTCTI